MHLRAFRHCSFGAVTAHRFHRVGHCRNGRTLHGHRAFAENVVTRHFCSLDRFHALLRRGPPVLLARHPAQRVGLSSLFLRLWQERFSAAAHAYEQPRHGTPWRYRWMSSRLGTECPLHNRCCIACLSEVIASGPCHAVCALCVRHVCCVSRWCVVGFLAKMEKLKV